MSHHYTFTGLPPYIEAAAKSTGVNEIHMVKAMGIWHCGQIQDALGQLTRVAPQHREALLQHAIQVRNSLAAVLAGIDTAIDDVRVGAGMVAPADLKPIKQRTKDLGIHQSDLRRVEPDVDPAPDERAARPLQGVPRGADHPDADRRHQPGRR